MRGQVVEFRDTGVVIRLDDGERAWLPARELLPDFRPHEHLSDRAPCRIGEWLDLVTFSGPRQRVGGGTVVSHVRAVNDPWREVSHWHDGDVKAMEVRVVTQDKALGTIPGGITGAVRVLDVTRLFTEPWDDFGVVLPGDIVAGRYRADQTDDEQRVVFLDAAAFVRSPVHVWDVLAPHLEPSTDLPALTPHVPEPREHYQGVGTPMTGPMRRVLVVDDDHAFADGVRRSLSAHGVEVIVRYDAESFACALEEMDAAGPIDLAIVDLNLAHGRREGLRLAATIQDLTHEVPIALVTGDDTFLASPGAPDELDLRVCGFFLKPIFWEDLVLILASASAPPQPLRDLVTGRREVRSADVHADDTRDLFIALDDLREDLGITSTALFSMHPISQQVRIVERSPFPGGLVRRIEPSIERSPIRDVALRNEQICAEDTTEAAIRRKHKWLVRAYRYRACLGVRVELRHELRFALFAFDSAARPDLASSLPRMRRAARQLACILRAQQVERQLEAVKPHELLGKAYGSMAHDLSYSLSADLDLRAELALLDQQSELSGADLGRLRRLLATLDMRLDSAARIVRTFREVARGASGWAERFELVPQLDGFVREICEQHSLPCTGPFLTAHGGAEIEVEMPPMALKQIVFNLLLNADQQIRRFPLRPADAGEMVVEVDVEDGSDGRWALIRVYDNGPGIHASQFTEVFDVGFSTKPGGFGMGLDICRNLARDVRVGDRRGDVRVWRSVLFVGTAFEVRLPI